MTRLDYNLDCTSTKTPSSSVYETRSRLTLINGRDLIATEESTYWRKHIKVEKSRNLRMTFGGRFWIRGHQTSILAATTLSRRAQKHEWKVI